MGKITGMKTPPLIETHRSAGAKIVEYAGWLLPIDYGSALRESAAVRNAAGLFDVSHMGRVDIVGKDAQFSLQRLLTNDIALLGNGAGQYTLMCNDAGGVIDDLIVYRRASESFLLVVNAANMDKDKAWISSHLPPDVRMEDCTEATAMFALQGPRSVEILRDFGVVGAGHIPRFHFTETITLGARIFAARTGYTGEDGFEIICATNDAQRVWSGLLEAGSDLGIQPCGLAARDILRIEAGLPLYGHELSENITLAQVGLMRFARLTKGEFIGRAAIAATASNGPNVKLVGIEMEGRTVPRDGDTVLTDHGRGRVTSGTYSPTLGRGIAMAYLPKQTAEDERVVVELHGAQRMGFARKLPMYRKKTPEG